MLRFSSDLLRLVSILPQIAAILSKLIPGRLGPMKKLCEVATVTQIEICLSYIHARGSKQAFLQVPIKELTIAARYAEVSLPQKFLPRANGRMVRSTGLLSMDILPSLT